MRGAQIAEQKIADALGTIQRHGGIRPKGQGAEIRGAVDSLREIAALPVGRVRPTAARGIGPDAVLGLCPISGREASDQAEQTGPAQIFEVEGVFHDSELMFNLSGGRVFAVRSNSNPPG